jgi:hypothetical protein
MEITCLNRSPDFVTSFVVQCSRARGVCSFLIFSYLVAKLLFIVDTAVIIFFCFVSMFSLFCVLFLCFLSFVFCFYVFSQTSKFLNNFLVLVIGYIEGTVFSLYTPSVVTHSRI